VKVTVPAAFRAGVEPRTAEMEEAAMVVPTTPVDGSLVVSEGEALPTISSAMPEPQVLVSALFPHHRRTRRTTSSCRQSSACSRRGW